MKRLKNLFFALALCAPLTAAAQSFSINELNFPDENFRNWLLSQIYGEDGRVTTEEMKQITGINVASKNISSLEGIGLFRELTSLICNDNQLRELDVSNNTKLIRLECKRNQLKLLDVSKHTELTQLECSDNQLTTLDVSNNTALTELECYNNQLRNLDVSNNTALAYLYCNGNQLTTLDVSNNTKLSTLYCGSNPLTKLDVSNNTKLSTLYCGSNPLTKLDVSNNTALTWLDCYNNQLTALDVSKNTALTWLDCCNNQLTTLDVSNNTKLSTLYCYNNQIKGKTMDALISSLPETTIGRLYAYNDNPYINDGNVITKSQVAAAKAKGWISYDGWSWDEYEGIDEVTIVSIGEDGLATYCPKYGIDLTSAENIAAYKAAVNGNIVTLTKVETVAPGEGVLLRSLSGSSVEEELPIALDATANTDNAFVGTLTYIYLYETTGNATNFVLSKVDGVVGFFKANNIWLYAGKAYLPVKNYDAARGLTITFDGTTGIIDVVPEQSTTDEAVYTLDGVRVATPTKGLYIKNGKKIFVK